MIIYFTLFILLATSKSFPLARRLLKGKIIWQRKIFTDIEYRHKSEFIETRDKKPREEDREGNWGKGVLHTHTHARDAEENPRYSRLSRSAPRSQVSRGARSAADHFDLRPHQSSPNHTPLISAWHESRRTFPRNGQKRTYSPPPPSSSSRPFPLAPLVSFVHPRFPLIVKTRIYDVP